MILFKETTSVKKELMKTSIGSLTQTLRLLTGKESKFHSPLTDLELRLTAQLLILFHSFMLKNLVRIFPRKALMKTFTGSLTQILRP